MAGNASRENGKNGGRPPGSKNELTLKREAVLKELQQRVMVAADLLFDSQFTLARGCSYLYKIEKFWKKVGKKNILIRKPPKLVKSEEEIRQYLAGLVDDLNLEDDPHASASESDPAATYYYITTDKPDNRAIDSLYARTFGRAVQPITFRDEEDLYDEESKTHTKKALEAFIGSGAAVAAVGAGHPRARRAKKR